MGISFINKLSKVLKLGIEIVWNQVAKIKRLQIFEFVAKTQFLLRFSSGAGHYTQLVWAESSEIGCGSVYYKVGSVYYKFFFRLLSDLFRLL